MSLYTCIDDDRGELIVLNKKYTKEQLREKLLPANYCKTWLDHILDEGVYLKQPLVKKVYAKEANAYMTTQEEGHKVTFKATQTIVVYPDGSWRDATFSEKLTKKVDDGMWGSVLCTYIVFGNKETMTAFGKQYEKEQIREYLFQKKYSEQIVNDIMKVGRHRDYPQLIELSATKENWGIIDQYLEGVETQTRIIRKKRWIVVYPNGFWRFATFKEIISGTVLS